MKICASIAPPSQIPENVSGNAKNKVTIKNLSNPRRKFTENEKLVLYSEVGGVCPLCSNDLMYEKSKTKNKNFEIAHIYPLNPKPEELIVLKDVKRLNSDINHLDNLLCLCNGCHTKFDNPRTKEEYEELFTLKSGLIKLAKEKKLWSNSTLENEISELINCLVTTDFVFTNGDILSYNPKTITEKTNATITVLTKRKIERNVQDYFSFINFKFSEIDKIKPTTTETISTQIKLHYLKLKKEIPDYNQKEVFDAMVNWFQITSQNSSKEACEIIVSYFIQNCEVFE
ncbi:ABC-three component system protein [Chryseobacterium sp.]|uniref:ABC-three component system protein n=1 Tax=Chryseobacterium sp. TaxID=1871047 RepID=UPI0012AA760A|nr:ABC-three component system protein [Chryseobacterium sp.]QFG52958.1 HNH endonuclease [Chryseobacterium sp.]